MSADFRPSLYDAVHAARLNEQRRRDSIVRCDRIVWPAWKAVPDDTRAVIEAAIPAGCVLTLTARAPLDYTARLFHGTQILAIADHLRDVEEGCQRVLRLVGVTV